MTASLERTTASRVIAVPAIVRGRIFTEAPIEFGGRDGQARFATPDPRALTDTLTLSDPGELADLQALQFDEIVEYLDELGRRLQLDNNPHLQLALEASIEFSDLTAPLIEAAFRHLPAVFAASAVRELAAMTIGTPYTNGWVPTRTDDGRRVSIRAAGARAVHIIAGNHPLIAAMTIVRNAVTRSDAIIKTPSNDPLTATAIAQTMCEFAPDHPITRHLSVVYWKGGDAEVEQALFQPRHIEKIIAWGGLASVTHVLRYVRPGIELVTLDPKRSASIIGRDAFASPESLRDAAVRAASDIGALNQLGCVNARVIYVACGLDPDGLARADQLGAMIYAAMQELPSEVSTPAKHIDGDLRGQVESLKASPDFYHVHGGGPEGAVIVSCLDEPVEFHRSLGGRVANLVPIERPTDALPRIDTSTQTIGVYPDSLKAELRDRLALAGAQRLTSLGYAADPHLSLPQDAIEPVRRMVKWIVDETCDPTEVPPMWEIHT